MRISQITATVAVAALNLAGQVPAANPVPDIPRRDVAGGTPADALDFPFAVIVWKGYSPSLSLCSGVLIAKDTVLTAAHCVDGAAGRYGDLGVLHGFPGSPVALAAEQFAMHPLYDPLSRPEGYAHDIALIRLESEFLSRTAAAARIADRLDGLHVHSGRQVTAVGWAGEVLRSGTANLETCAEIPDSAVCTDSLLEEGDSGGPLLMRRNHEWVVVGIGSWLASDQSRYVRASEHRDWIDSMIAAWPDPGNTVYGTSTCQLTFEGSEAVLTIEGTPVRIDRSGSGSVWRPPAPDPAPPPFQPGPVEVMLGAFGEKVTLMTKQRGGFTLSGSDFDGGDIKAENGATYTLRLQDGRWVATYKQAKLVIALGCSGESLTLMTKQGGGFTLDGADFPGGEVTAGGETYSVSVGEYAPRLADKEAME